MKIIYTDVLVIGGGLAGLRIGIGAKRRGHDVIILSLVPPKRSHSSAAQGGMQASLGNVIKGEGDNEDVHFEDTVRGSDWGADQEVVRMFVDTAPKAVRELAAWGLPWSRVTKGDREVIINGQKVTITERDAAHGLIAQRAFGGTNKWRTCYVSDGTGHAMLFTMSDQAIANGIPVHERAEAIALIHDAGRCPHGCEDPKSVPVADRSGETVARDRLEPAQLIGKEPRQQGVRHDDRRAEPQPDDQRRDRPFPDEHHARGRCCEVDEHALALLDGEREAVRPDERERDPAGESGERAHEQHLQAAELDRDAGGERERGESEQRQASPAPGNREIPAVGDAKGADAGAGRETERNPCECQDAG
jgi:FAD binding domain